MIRLNAELQQWKLGCIIAPFLPEIYEAECIADYRESKRDICVTRTLLLPGAILNGYAHVCLPETRFERLNKEFGMLEDDSGRIVVCVQNSWGGREWFFKCRHLEQQQYDGLTNNIMMERSLVSYLKSKDLTFLVNYDLPKKEEPCDEKASLDAQLALAPT